MVITVKGSHLSSSCQSSTVTIFFSTYCITSLLQLSEEVKVAKETENKTESSERENQEEDETVKDGTETKTAKPEEEGEIEEGEETASTSKSSDVELKELRASLK